MPHTPLIGTFCWFDLGTTDAVGAKRFYAALCGWTFVDVPMGAAGVYTLVSVGGHEIGGLYELSGPMSGLPPHFLFYVRVAGADAAVARCAGLGGGVDLAGHDIPGRGRMAMLGDPDGARFAIFESRGHDGTTVAPHTVGAFCWHELQTRHPERAVAFYRELFGWSAQADGGPQPYTEFALGIGDAPFAGMIRMDERFGAAPPNWMGYLAVDDCDAAAQRAGAFGAGLLFGPRDIPGVGRFAVLADPQGAAFAVIQLSS